MKVGKNELGSLYNTDITVNYDYRDDLVELEWHTEGGTYNRIQVGPQAEGLEEVLDAIEEISKSRHDDLYAHLKRIREIVNA